MTIITYWKDADTQGIGAPVELVGFYFGDYNEKDTDFYIDQWLDNRSTEISVLKAAEHFMDAYLLVNREFIEQSEAERLENAIGGCKDLLYDRSWEFELNALTNKRMLRSEYLAYIEQLYASGKIDEDAMDSLCMLANNYPTQL